MGKKQDVIAEIFEVCKRRKNFTFDNSLVKKICKHHRFGNPFDATKLDDTSEFPEVLLAEDLFIAHLGEGKHRFMKGIKKAFHAFEEVDKARIFAWKYRKSILNEIDTSESNILSVASNQRIIHDFHYEDIVASPMVYGAKRTKMNLSYRVGQQLIEARNLQMEIDLTMELHGAITVFEGKNGFPSDFAIYQLFHPYKYYTHLKKINKLNATSITCCYVLRKAEREKSVLRLYNYTFDDENDMASIRLLKNAQYELVWR